jgi:DNA-binding transcriptional ArsR family regulator
VLEPAIAGDRYLLFVSDKLSEGRTCFISSLLYNDHVMQQIDSVFSALADPTRRAILARLALGEATVNELAAPFAMSQPAISRHLKLLEGAGLVRRRIEGTKRPCRLAIEGLTDVETYLTMLRKTLEANYRRLDALLAETDPLTPTSNGKDES